MHSEPVIDTILSMAISETGQGNRGLDGQKSNVGCGVLVGMVVAMYLPIFDIMNTLHQLRTLVDLHALSQSSCTISRNSLHALS